jgi:hypothetical protein
MAQPLKSKTLIARELRREIRNLERLLWLALREISSPASDRLLDRRALEAAPTSPNLSAPRGGEEKDTQSDPENFWFRTLDQNDSNV